MAVLLVATDGGVVRLVRAGGRWRAESAVTPDGGAGGRQVYALAADPRRTGLVLAATADGVWASRDAGASWAACRPVGHPVMSVAVSAADGRWYAGTEPSLVFASADGGETWQELDGLRRVPSRPRWSFPPRPWTHHVATLAPHPADPAVLLAGIELGGVMRTADGGRTFADHAPGAHLDSHVLLVHPADPDRAYQGAGEGTAESRDGGRTWTATDAGLVRRYVTALAVDAREPDLVYAATSPSAGRAWYSDNAEARLFVRRDGKPWELLSGRADGLPEHFTAPVTGLCADPDEPGTVYAACQDGAVWRGEAAGGRWRALAVEAGGAMAEVGDVTAV